MPRSLPRWFLALCDAWLAMADERRRYRTRRDGLLDGLAFPYADFRPGQREMAARVYRTARDGGACLLQAPHPASGKTMAALYPALKAAGRRPLRPDFLSDRPDHRQGNRRGGSGAAVAIGERSCGRSP